MQHWLKLYTSQDITKFKGWVSNLPPGVWEVTARKLGGRSNSQNELMWALLHDISKQLPWHGEFLKDYEWKDLFTASLRSYRIVEGIEPGTKVPLGMRTSHMNKEEMSELIELIQAFGVNHGVTFKDMDKAA